MMRNIVSHRGKQHELSHLFHSFSDPWQTKTSCSKRGVEAAHLVGQSQGSDL